MKKILLLMFISITFVLSGCSQKNEAEITTNTESPKSTENTVTATPFPQEENPILSTFSISSTDIANIVYNTNVESFSKSIGTYTIDVFPCNDYLLFCVTSDNDSFPSCVYAYDQARSGTSESAIKLLQPFFDSLPTNQNIQEGTYNLGNSYGVLYCIWTDGFNANEFPFTIQLIPDMDYFLYTDSDEYKRACSEGRYDDILFDVNSYIDEYNPSTYDNAYTLQSILTPIIDNWENIEVNYDPVENYATFYYSNVDEISNNVHFVPYALTNEKHIRSLIGFYNSDWLFFNSITISSDDNIRISTSSNKIEDVISGGKIYEAYSYLIDDDDLTQLLSSPNHIIRFQGKNDNHIDYEMTAEEYEALVTISKFQNIRNILSDLLFWFQKRQ